MPLTLPNSVEIQTRYPMIYEALRKVQLAINQGHGVAGVDPVGVVATPTNAGSMVVAQSNGIYDVAINDPSPQRGETYFIEWDTQASFGTARTISLGASRNWRGTLGNIGTTYWRFAKQLLGSNISNWISFGSAVTGGGSAGPALGAPMGSGTSQQPGQGIGAIGPTPQPTQVRSV